jgi:hypothetical protein
MLRDPRLLRGQPSATASSLAQPLSFPHSASPSPESINSMLFVVLAIFTGLDPIGRCADGPRRIQASKSGARIWTKLVKLLLDADSMCIQASTAAAICLSWGSPAAIIKHRPVTKRPNAIHLGSMAILIVAPTTCRH